MYPDIYEKINLLKQIDSYDARFVIKVLESFNKKQIKFKENKKNTSIITKNQNTHSYNNVIDLDKIWVKPYFYTNMRLRLEKIVTQVIGTSNEVILKNPSKFLKKAIFNNASKNFEMPENNIDIADFIKQLDKSNFINNFIFIAQTIDEETLFKEEQIKNVIEIINCILSTEGTVVALCK